jgi:D-threo-aldose 1-dehydrogenase
MRPEQLDLAQAMPNWRHRVPIGASTACACRRNARGRVDSRKSSNKMGPPNSYLGNVGLKHRNIKRDRWQCPIASDWPKEVSDMNPFRVRRIGNTSFEVTQLGMGGASIGDAREVIPEQQAEATLEAGHVAGIGYFDTSPWYGNTKSELRFGRILRTKPRDSFVISTKVGRVHVRPAEPDTYAHPRWVGGLPFEPRFDYTHDAILKSYEMSLARLGLNRVDALLIHDLDPRHQQSEEGVQRGLEQLDTGGGYQALADLKARGEIKAIGAGVNHVGMIPRFVERF